MRKTAMLVGIPVVVLGVAVAVGMAKYRSSPKTPDAFAQDLQQAQAAGLDLAQSQNAGKYALTEIAPDSKPLPSKAIKQGNGAKAIRSKTPTIKAAPEPVAAITEQQIPQTQSTATAAPTPADVPVPAVPRPVPQTTDDQGPILAGGSGRGRTGTDGGIGLGGILGAIIRGGVMDGDNCDPHPNGNRPPMRGPIYGGNPNTGGRIRPGMPTPAGSMGGTIMGGARRRR